MSNFMSKIKEKRWDASSQPQIFQRWEQEGIYRFDKNSQKPIFAIDTPPPYANAPWHVGGAIHYAYQDFFVRYLRMKGYELLYPMGLDRNGLPVEVQTEIEFGIKMHETPRGEFIQKCEELLSRYGDQILSICRRLGISYNSLEWDEVYKTDQPEYRAQTQATIIELWHKGLIYEDDRPNNWCSECGTTLADAEIEYREMETTLVTMRFKVKETGEDLHIVTTRPELLPAIGLVIYHPDDTRYQHLEGKTAITPLFEIEVPIITDREAQMDFGTGIAMMCSFGDLTDIRLFSERQIPPRYAINAEGRMTELASKYKGMTVKDARAAVIEDMKEQGLLIKQEKTQHRQPVCWRSKTPIEFIGMKEYYLKQQEFIPILLEYADKVEWHPRSMKQVWINWLNAIRQDWPISRRRFYGTELPIWYCKKCGTPHLPPPGKYYRPWRDPAPFDTCSKCSETEFVGETRTVDTWLDSSISHIYITSHPHNKHDPEVFERILDQNKREFICSLRPNGIDIVRTWFHYAMLRTEQLYQMSAFQHAWISGMVVAHDGRPMSKSLGNVVDPYDEIDKYGSDAFRLFGALEASHGSNIRYAKERVAGVSRFMQKLWSISRYISAFPEPTAGFKLTATDKWILAELNQLTQEVDRTYITFDFNPGAKAIRHFIWEVFADHYIELAKSRAYNRENVFTEGEQQSVWYALHLCARTLLKLLAPICPFITEAIWIQLYSTKSIHLEKFPEPLKDIDPTNIENTTTLMTLNSAIWALKKQYNRSLRSEMEEICLPTNLMAFSKDLQAMHNAKLVSTTEMPQTEWQEIIRRQPTSFLKL